MLKVDGHFASMGQHCEIMILKPLCRGLTSLGGHMSKSARWQFHTGGLPHILATRFKKSDILFKFPPNQSKDLTISKISLQLH